MKLKRDTVSDAQDVTSNWRLNFDAFAPDETVEDAAVQVGGPFTEHLGQYGLVDVATLPAVPAEGGARSAPASPPAQPSSVAAQPATDVFVALERLGELHGKGILSDEEFASKKA